VKLFEKVTFLTVGVRAPGFAYSCLTFLIAVKHLVTPPSPTYALGSYLAMVGSESFFFFSLFIHLFICVYIAWAISPLCSPAPSLSPSAPSFPDRTCSVLFSNFVEEKT
jgi:hypothetical protein